LQLAGCNKGRGGNLGQAGWDKGWALDSKPMSQAVSNAESCQAANIWLNTLKQGMKFEWKEYVKFIMLFNECDIIWPHILAYH